MSSDPKPPFCIAHAFDCAWKYPLGVGDVIVLECDPVVGVTHPIQKVRWQHNLVLLELEAVPMKYHHY